MTQIVESDGGLRFLQQGPDYYEVLPEIARRMNCRSYFEVGVNTGRSLTAVAAPTVGVDPEFRLKFDVMGAKPWLKLYQMTSDDFFATHNLSQLFGTGVDLAFLDGMHRFEFLLRDFINTERHMEAGGMILLHDCLPINAEMTERERNGKARRDGKYRAHWTGDVWKMIPVLQAYRPDLAVACLDCTPTGLAVIRNLDPGSTALQDNYEEIVERFIPVALDDDSVKTYFEEHPSFSAELFLESLSILSAT